MLLMYDQPFISFHEESSHFYPKVVLLRIVVGSFALYKFLERFRTFESIPQHSRTIGNVMETLGMVGNIPEHLSSLWNIPEHYRILWDILEHCEPFEDFFVRVYKQDPSWVQTSVS